MLRNRTWIGSTIALFVVAVSNSCVNGAEEQGVTKLPPPPRNIVAIHFSTSTNTLTLHGDAAANVIKISKIGSTLLLTTLLLEPEGTIPIGEQTKLTLSIDSGPVSSPMSTTTILDFTGKLIIDGYLSQGNDIVTLVGLPIAKITLNLGDGNDTASFLYCTVKDCAIDGGAGVNWLRFFATQITNNHIRDFHNPI